MQPNSRINFVIDSVSATTTDHFKVVNQLVYIGETSAKIRPVCRYLDIVPGTYQKSVATAEQLQVTTLTPVGTTNSITYSIKIDQLNPVTEDWITKTYTITTPATGTVSATTIATQFRTEINADPSIHVAATGSSTLILTAETGYAKFTVTILNTGLGLTQSTGTAGIYPFGLTPYYDLQRCGLTSSDYTGSTAGYTKFTFVANVPQIDNTFTKAHQLQVNVFINTDDSEAAALIAAIIDLFDASQTVLDDVQLIP